MTTQQVAGLFTGRVRNWSETDERAVGNVYVVVRTDDQNVTEGFEQSLGITGQVVQDAERIRSDQKVLSRVSGQLDAVGYLSLHAALEAVTYGISVRMLIIDGVEPAAPTVQSGTYRLKRPVVLLTRKQASPLAKAFVEFARSPAGASWKKCTFPSTGDGSSILSLSPSHDLLRAQSLHQFLLGHDQGPEPR